MKPLTYRELTANLTAQGLTPLLTTSGGCGYDLTTVVQRDVLQNQPCPRCKHAPRDARLFVSRLYQEQKTFAICPNCGHCERI